MNLGFDFDKVFINYPPLVPHVLIDRLYKKKANGTLLYRIPSKPEQILRIATHHPILRKPIMENMQYIRSIAGNKDHKYYVISSRFGFLKRRTEDLIKRHELDSLFHGLFFNYSNEQPHIFKDRMIKKLHIHRYIDDDLRLLEYLLTKNKSTVFFWLNKSHNGFLKKNLFGITKLSSFINHDNT